MAVDLAIQKHGAMKIFEAAAKGECGDLAPRRKLGLTVETMDDAEMISFAVDDAMSAAEKAEIHWEVNQDLHKYRKQIVVSVGRFGLQGWSSNES